MGTFHDDKGELHGITVAVNMADDRVFVGRCHEADERKVILLDVAEHREGQDGLSNADYLKRAAKWGVFKQHDHLVLDQTQVAGIQPLGAIDPTS
jgi:hypothetical protein